MNTSCEWGLLIRFRSKTKIQRAVTCFATEVELGLSAKSMSIPFLDEIHTSIHLTDNIGLEYSHFYNEVLKIKDIATALKEEKKCLIIIDELFRGTNYEDAKYCSEQVLSSFESIRNSFF